MCLRVSGTFTYMQVSPVVFFSLYKFAYIYKIIFTVAKHMQRLTIAIDYEHFN